MFLQSPPAKKARFGECNSGCLEDFATQLVATQPRDVQTWVDVNGVPDHCQHLKGVFKGASYDSDFPPPMQFRNHVSCSKFTRFVSEEILKRVTTKAIRVWGKVGVDSPPCLVLPLTVEPSKPRLCVDARFLNLWMKDMPFSLDKLADVSRYIYIGSFMTKCDDKSGYDHVLLSSSS